MQLGKDTIFLVYSISTMYFSNISFCFHFFSSHKYFSFIFVADVPFSVFADYHHINSLLSISKSWLKKF